jgi:aspartate aminotransferase
MSSDAMLDHEYLPIDGLKLFNEKASRLVLGDDSEAITQNRYCAIQCISGTGSLRIAMEFLRKFLQTEFVYISKPTWRKLVII